MPLVENITENNLGEHHASVGAGVGADTGAGGGAGSASVGAKAGAGGGAGSASVGADTDASDQEFRPKILAFTCRWCTYAGADLAGLNRMKYPADIRLLRIPCSGRVNPQHVLEALQHGADGVLVCGCHPGDCHYATGNYYAKRRLMIFKRELEYIGLEPKRFQVRWISGAEAGKFRDTATEFCETIRELGPINNDFTLQAFMNTEFANFSDNQSDEHHTGLQSEDGLGCGVRQNGDNEKDADNEGGEK